MAIAQVRGLLHEVEAGGGDDVAGVGEVRGDRVDVAVARADHQRVAAGVLEQLRDLFVGAGVDDERVRGPGERAAGPRRRELQRAGVDQRVGDGLELVGDVVVGERPVEALGVFRPVQAPGDVPGRRELDAAELAEDPAGEAVDDQLVGRRERRLQPGPERLAVVAERSRHRQHAASAGHAHVAGVGRGGEQDGVELERVEHLARAGEVAEATAEGVVEDHWASASGRVCVRTST